MTRLPARAFAALAVVALLAPPGLQAKQPLLFEIADPRGDDHGDGALVYPDNDDYGRGELDLLSFAARRGDGGTWFVAEMARPVREPDGRIIDDLGTRLDSVAREGFYTFNIDVYIDMDRQPGSGGQYTLPGRRVQIAPEFAWDRAVVLTPRPHYARSELRRSMMKALRREMKKDQPELTDEQAEAMILSIPDDVERHVWFPNQTRTTGRRIEFFVPDSFLGGAPDPSWAYVVLVTAAELEASAELAGKLGLTDPPEERLLIRPLATGRPRHAVGGGREDHTLQPPIFDILAPAGATQEQLLRDYDQRQDRAVKLPGVVAGG